MNVYCRFYSHYMGNHLKLFSLLFLFFVCSCSEVPEFEIKEHLLKLDQSFSKFEARRVQNRIEVHAIHKGKYFLEDCVNKELYKLAFAKDQSVWREGNIDEIHIKICWNNLRGCRSISIAREEVQVLKRQLFESDSLETLLTNLYRDCDNDDLVAYNAMITDLRETFLKGEFVFEGCYPELITQGVDSDSKKSSKWHLQVLAHGIAGLDGDYNTRMPSRIAENLQ